MPPFPVYGIMPKRNSVCQREWGRFMQARVNEILL